jgi:hypothetical protein
VSVTKGARRLAYYRRRATETTGAERRQHEASAEVELQKLRAAQRCEDCGTPLSDPVSKQRRIGPSCWAKKPHAAA